MSLAVNWAFPSWVKGHIRRRIKLIYMRRHGDQLQCRVWNNSSWAAEKTVVYLTIYHDVADLCEPPNPPKPVYISRSNPTQIIRDRVFWSLSGNPHEICVQPGEDQAFAPFVLHRDMIEIASENGLSSHGGTSRAYLIRKKYLGLFKVVSSSFLAKEFHFALDPDCESSPLKIGRGEDCC